MNEMNEEMYNHGRAYTDIIHARYLRQFIKKLVFIYCKFVRKIKSVVYLQLILLKLFKFYLYIYIYYCIIYKVFIKACDIVRRLQPN